MFHLTRLLEELTLTYSTNSKVNLLVEYLKKRTIEEACDVIYHLLVLLSSKKITYNDLKKELKKREDVR